MTPLHWILLDTETNGIAAPVYAVEIGAQKMHGWLPEGPPFRRLLNHNADISPEASRINGYTREILERDGDDPVEVYRDFARYAGDAPLVSYNLRFDLDQVLLPEWKRLGLAPIGQRGFCALELTRRLLDPVPAGNCKLQTLRQFYRLPERGAHTALGDVQTVVDLLDQVLRPLAEARGLHQWSDLLAFTEQEWFPSVIGFGKFKGRNFRQATNDPDLMQWLHWLASAKSEHSSRMGQWYLAQLQAQPTARPILEIDIPDGDTDAPAGQGLVVYHSPQIAQLKRLIQASRDRLAELEADYTARKRAVDVIMAQLFTALRTEYQKRDQLKLRIDYQRRYLETLMHSGDEEAEEVKKEHDEARQQTDEEYEQAATDAAGKHALSDEETREIKNIWRKLVRMFHPDRHMDNLKKRDAYTWLTAQINQARDHGDIVLLRRIAQDPNAFLQQHGKVVIDSKDAEDVSQLRDLLDSLQQLILETLEAISSLQASAGYEIYRRCQTNPDFFASAVDEHRQVLEAEIAALEDEAAQLADEIEGLSGVKM